MLILRAISSVLQSLFFLIFFDNIIDFMLINFFQILFNAIVAMQLFICLRNLIELIQLIDFHFESFLNVRYNSTTLRYL